MAEASALITLGKITSVYGVKGWVKVFSHTEPMDQILDYTDWVLERDGERQAVRAEKGKSHGKGMIAHIAGVDTREAAEQLAGYEIRVRREQLPDLPEGQYYWWQLEGCQVQNLSGESLGKVSHLISAGGANDVLVVADPAAEQGERLIPFVPDVVVHQVDLDAAMIRVDWQPEF